MGYTLESVHWTENPLPAIQRADAIFIGGGNTFRLLKALQDLDLLEPIRRRVKNGTPYIGSSAGRRTNDQDDQRHANRSTTLIRFARTRAVSNQPALSRSRPCFNAHG
jgi:glutamine amidotransferase PdxT